MAGDPNFVRALIEQEIAAMVADARNAGEILNASRCAKLLLITYSGCGFSEPDLIRLVRLAGDAAGVAAE